MLRRRMVSTNPRITQIVKLSLSDTFFPIRKHDWDLIRRLVNNLPKQRKWLSNLSSTFLGAGISGLLAYFPLIGVESLKSWLLPTILSISVAFLALSLILFLLDHYLSKDFQSSVESLNIELDEVEKLVEDTSKESVTPSIAKP